MTTTSHAGPSLGKQLAASVAMIAVAFIAIFTVTTRWSPARYDAPSTFTVPTLGHGTNAPGPEVAWQAHLADARAGAPEAFTLAR